MSSPLLSLHQLGKAYDRPVLSNVNLVIEQHSCTLLVGNCGSGKSVLLQIIAQLEQPDQGKLCWHGSNQRATLMLQDASLQLIGQSVWQDVLLSPTMTHHSYEKAQEIAHQALVLLQLEELKEQSPLTLSGGQMRKVLLAGMLTQESDLFLLDEPFANLDYPSILQVRAAISQLQALGKTIIIATHEIEKAISLASDLVVLKNGQVALQQSLRDGSRIDWQQYQLKDPYSIAANW